MKLRKRKIATSDNSDRVVHSNIKKRRNNRGEKVKKSKDTLIVKEKTESKEASVIEELGSKATTESKETWKIEDYLTDSEWRALLLEEFNKDYFKRINETLKLGYEKALIRPAKELVFNAFNSTRLSDVRVVILGQDPYHDDGQAHGLAFSVPSNIKLPRTLKNILNELERDIYGFEREESLGGCLEKWCAQGVFLLNSFLTVEAHKPGSHSKIGWSLFTDNVIKLISEKNDGCVFLLWGNFAHKKESLIESGKHKIIKSAHPSPLTFQKFFNSKCFSEANEFLKSISKTPVNWSLKR